MFNRLIGNNVATMQGKARKVFEKAPSVSTVGRNLVRIDAKTFRR